MSHTTFFVQECPTCGRRLQIRVAYLGKRLYCQHCSGAFFASDNSAGVLPLERSSDELMERAEQLLAFADRQKSHALLGHEWAGGEQPAY